MGLQVWLPLNGNLDNQGIGQITNISGTPSYKEPGKLGKNALNLKTRITFTCPQLANLQTFTVAFWGIAQSSSTLTTNWQDLIGFNDVSSSGTSGVFRWETTYSSSNGIHWHDNATNALVNGSHNHTTVKDIWVHCCVVFDQVKGKIYSYDNGVLTQTHDHLNGKFNTAGTFYLGETNNIEGMIQDVRFYDHALSDKEVEELAKGLVLHYKLDDATSLTGASNLCEGALSGTCYSAASPGTWGAHKYYAISTDATATDPIPQSKKTVLYFDYNTSYGSGGGGSVWPTKDYIVVEPSTTYTYSRYIKPSDDFTYVHGNFLYRYERTEDAAVKEGGLFSKTNTIYVGNGWYRCWATFTTASTTTRIRLPFFSYPGKSMTYEISGVMLEKNSILSEYVPGANTPIAYDSSGYGNHGIVTGSLTMDTNTVRYKYSTKQANGQYIRVEKRPAECLPKDKMTVSLWIYCTTWGNPISCTEGGGWNFESGSTGLRFPVYISGVGYKYQDTTITVSSLLNAWHMITGVFDGSNVLTYIDGVLQTTIATGSTNGIGYANNYLFIGAEAGGNTTTPASSTFAGNLSDLRIYATALTAAQIQELYNTSATIDNKGNTYARELVET